MPRRPAQTQPSLFGSERPMVRDGRTPLAERMRPRDLSEFVGQAHLVAPGRLLRELIEGQRLHSLILWGPPGSGKTTLAHLIADSSGAHCISFSAVLSGVKELRAVVEEAQVQRRYHGRASVLVVDEIHRFNKAQQDAFLPHVEDGTVVLIGATTENPSFEIIAPLLSRASVLVLEPLTTDDLRVIVRRALEDEERGLGGRGLSIPPEALEFLVGQAHGDARSALNVLEAAADLASRRRTSELSLALLEEASQRRAVRYDKKGDEHYNVISAFIKSMRGSDPDAAVYWLMRMIEAGEDPLFIARRMIIFAAEDIGNADPQALSLAVAAKDAFHFIGLPEGRIPLTQAAVYLACAPKSNASIKAMAAAAEDVRRHGALPVPLRLRNPVTPLMKGLGYGRDYQYAHDQEAQVVTHEHLPEALRGRRYYTPAQSGVEAAIAERLAEWRRKREERTEGFEGSRVQGVQGEEPEDD
jgi:putative ATPase